jgi:thiol-disulfide isomerase/thioredoxin
MLGSPLKALLKKFWHNRPWCPPIFTYFVAPHRRSMPILSYNNKKNANLG